MFKKRFVYIGIIIAIMLSAVNILFGYSSFITNDSFDLNDGCSALKSSEPVCYFNKNGTDVYFTSIEKALDTASALDTEDVIYVIPNNINLNVTITRNAVLSSKDTLILPYEGTSWDMREGTSTNANRFADYTEQDAAANRKTLVKIAKGVTLTINGTLKIGGILGSKTQGLNGFTSGSYSEILLSSGSENIKGAQIIVNSGGKIDLRGYIKEDEFNDDISQRADVVFKSGSELKLPFVIYDYQGATATAGIFGGSVSGQSESVWSIIGKEYTPKNPNVCPFNLYDFPNMQVNTRIEAGSKMIGYVSLYTPYKEFVKIAKFQESWNLDEIQFITLNSESGSSVFYLDSGYIDIHYRNLINHGYSSVIPFETKTDIKINGDFTFDKLAMKISAQLFSISIDTSQVFFPISYKFNFIVNSGGIFNINNKMKFLPSSKFINNMGGTVNINSLVIFYSCNTSWTDKKTTVSYMDKYTGTTGALNPSHTSTINAKYKSTLENYGTLNLGSGSSLGGIINNYNGIVNNYGSNLSVSSKECNGTFEVDIGLFFNAKVILYSKDEVYINESGVINNI